MRINSINCSQKAYDPHFGICFTNPGAYIDSFDDDDDDTFSFREQHDLDNRNKQKVPKAKTSTSTNYRSHMIFGELSYTNDGIDSLKNNKKQVLDDSENKVQKFLKNLFFKFKDKRK